MAIPGKETTTYLVNVIFYNEAKSEAENPDYLMLNIPAKSFAEAEEKAVNFVGEKFLDRIESIENSDWVPVLD